MAGTGSTVGGLAGAGIGAIWGAPGVGGSIGSAIGGLFDGGDEPEWQNVNFQNINADDPRFKGTAQTNYGQDMARQEQGRYGIGGAFNKFMEGRAVDAKDQAFNRIMRLSAQAAPTTAQLRGGVSAQGAGGAFSNTIAKQQREQGQRRASEAGFGAYEQASSRIDAGLDRQFLASEQLRQGATGQFIGAQGRSSDAVNRMTQFNVGMQGDIAKTNAQGNLSADIANSQGKAGLAQGAAQRGFERSQGFGSMFGTMAGNEMTADAAGGGGGFDFNSAFGAAQGFQNQNTSQFNLPGFPGGAGSTFQDVDYTGEYSQLSMG